MTGGTTNLVAISLTTGGTSNTVNIAALPIIASYPAQFTVLKYSGAIGGAGYNFLLSPLPAGSYCGGYLSNNSTAGSVDLVITNCTVPDSLPHLEWGRGRRLGH